VEAATAFIVARTTLLLQEVEFFRQNNIRLWNTYEIETAGSCSYAFDPGLGGGDGVKWIALQAEKFSDTQHVQVNKPKAGDTTYTRFFLVGVGVSTISLTDIIRVSQKLEKKN
jgi:hypothetical protein